MRTIEPIYRAGEHYLNLSQVTSIKRIRESYTSGDQVKYIVTFINTTTLLLTMGEMNDFIENVDWNCNTWNKELLLHYRKDNPS